jgi:hypothetical protein
MFLNLFTEKMILQQMGLPLMDLKEYRNSMSSVLPCLAHATAKYGLMTQTSNQLFEARVSFADDFSSGCGVGHLETPSVASQKTQIAPSRTFPCTARSYARVQVSIMVDFDGPSGD